MNSDVWDNLESFVRKESGIFSDKTLNRDTSLEDDLDITGDDSDTFMERFFNYFSVDVGDFDIDRYFLGEGGNFLSLLVNAIFKRNAEKFHKIPLTLGMLEKAIILKKWNTKSIEN